MFVKRCFCAKPTHAHPCRVLGTSLTKQDKTIIVVFSQNLVWCACLPCPVMHGSEGSAWARNLGVPLSDLRPLCVSVAGGESRKTFTQFSKRENVKT